MRDPAVLRQGFLTVGEFVVMPNHVHGILILNNDQNGGRDNVSCRDKACLVSTSTVNKNQTIGQQRFQNQEQNTISSIVGGYKSAVTKHTRRLGYEFAWQPKFYDHIIRNDKSYNDITNYIIRNPQSWQKNKFYIDSKS